MGGGLLAAGTELAQPPSRQGLQIPTRSQSPGKRQPRTTQPDAGLSLPAPRYVLLSSSVVTCCFHINIAGITERGTITKPPQNTFCRTEGCKPSVNTRKINLIKYQSAFISGYRLRNSLHLLSSHMERGTLCCKGHLAHLQPPETTRISAPCAALPHPLCTQKL